MNPKGAFLRLTSARQEALLEIVMQTYLEQDYDAVTVRLLCKRMGINSATFYRYFDSRDDLLLYAIDRLDARVPRPTDSFPPFDAENPDYYSELEYQFLVRSADFPLNVIHDMFFRIGNRNQEQYEGILQNEQNRGHLRSGADISLIAYFYATTGYNLLRYCREHQLSQEEYIKRKIYLYYDFFFHGILNPDAPTP